MLKFRNAADLGIKFWVQLMLRPVIVPLKIFLYQGGEIIRSAY